MRLPHSRGPLSQAVTTALADDAAPSTATLVLPDEITTDADAQLALWTLYELAFRGFDEVDPAREWDVELLRLRSLLETAFERELRRATAAAVRTVVDRGDVGEELLRFAEDDDGPSLAAYLHRHATRDQILEFLRERSVYHLKESDPSAFVLPRLEGPPKVALAELLYDEFGGGRAHRLHSRLYGDALEACGLDREYGAYVDHVSATTLAVNNAMSLFGLHRRLRGAAMGHLAAFEATSSVPCRKIAAGIERVGLPDVAADYFHEHIEADAVHEQVAARDICGGLVAQDPTMRDDVLFGAAVCLHLDGLAAVEFLTRWREEEAA